MSDVEYDNPVDVDIAQEYIIRLNKSSSFILGMFLVSVGVALLMLTVYLLLTLKWRFMIIVGPVVIGCYIGFIVHLFCPET